MREPAKENDLAPLIRHMHDVAGKYHLHFSTVRTASNSLIIPIGLTASVLMLDGTDRIGWLFPILFVLFVVVFALALNLVFASWSRAALRIERYYERMLADQDYLAAHRFDAQAHGFRHLFYRITGGSQEPSETGQPAEGAPAADPIDPDSSILKPTPNWISRDVFRRDFLRAHLRDSFVGEPFVLLTWTGGLLYLVMYAVTVLWLAGGSGSTSGDMVGGAGADTVGARLAGIERDIAATRGEVGRLADHNLVLRGERDRAVAAIHATALGLRGIERQTAELRRLLAVREPEIAPEVVVRRPR